MGPLDRAAAQSGGGFGGPEPAEQPGVTQIYHVDVPSNVTPGQTIQFSPQSSNSNERVEPLSIVVPDTWRPGQKLKVQVLTSAPTSKTLGGNGGGGGGGGGGSFSAQQPLPHQQQQSHQSSMQQQHDYRMRQQQLLQGGPHGMHQQSAMRHAPSPPRATAPQRRARFQCQLYDVDFFVKHMKAAAQKRERAARAVAARAKAAERAKAAAIEHERATIAAAAVAEEAERQRVATQQQHCARTLQRVHRGRNARKRTSRWLTKPLSGLQRLEMHERWAASSEGWDFCNRDGRRDTLFDTADAALRPFWRLYAVRNPQGELKPAFYTAKGRRDSSVFLALHDWPIDSDAAQVYLMEVMLPKLREYPPICMEARTPGTPSDLGTMRKELAALQALPMPAPRSSAPRSIKSAADGGRREEWRRGPRGVPLQPTLTKAVLSKLETLQTNDELVEGAFCELCITKLDATEQASKPCSCGYRVCLFCKQKIDRCPNCRNTYVAAKSQSTATALKTDGAAGGVGAGGAAGGAGGKRSAVLPRAPAPLAQQGSNNPFAMLDSSEESESD